MGCTSSKENTNPPSTTLTDNNNQQLINEQFRQWLKSNRPKADEYVLNDIISTTKQTNNIDDYRPIVNKALDLLSEHSDIKTINKLNKLVQKEVSLASPKKVSHTIDILKKTAEKLRQGQIIFDDDDDEDQPPTVSNGEILNNAKTSETKQGQISSGEPGIALKEALEKARILFYKGKQAAIFANPSGGYDVRIIDENDDALNQDGNLLRSIIVTEVKMRPKPTVNSPKFTVPPPPPPSSKLLDENEIGDDFRRSIDAALKGLEAIYQTSPTTTTDNHQQQQKNFNDPIDKEPNEIILDTIESQKNNRVSSNEDIERRNNNEITTSPQQKVKLSNENRPKSFNINEENLDKNQYNLNKQMSFDETNRHKSTTNKIQEKSLTTSIEEYNKTLSDSLLTPVVSSVSGGGDDNNITTTTVKSPSHNVTYTEIIHSESHDGEQSRRFITESYDELPSNEDEQTTTLKVVTKSEFSNHPSLGEKIMEQSVQVITVKVRNETTTTTTNSPHTNDTNMIDTIS